MARLDRIEVEGFKSIRAADLELRPLNVLIGANGSGKSNFIALFSLLNRLVEQRLQEHVAASGGADALLYFGQKQTPELRLALHFGNNGYATKLAPSSDGGMFFVNEECWSTRVGHHDRYSIPLGTGQQETHLVKESNTGGDRIIQHTLTSLRTWKVYHFHDTSESARVKQLGDIDDNAFLKPDASNLAAFLFLLQQKHPGSYERIVRTIQMAAPFFAGFKLRPHPQNDQKIQLEWGHRDSDAYLNAHSLSDGTLRFICLTTLLLQPDLPTLVLIDEPELSLNPYAVVLLASLLKSTADAEKAQVVVSTQSVTLVNQLDPEDVLVVDREEEESIIHRPSPEEIGSWLEDYSLGDLWEKNIIGGRPS